MVETIKYASVSIEEVIASKLRLEANVFNVEGRKAKEVLKNCKWEIKTVCGQNGIATSFVVGRYKRNYVSRLAKGAIGFLGSSEMLEQKPNPLKYIIPDAKYNKFKVQKGWLLLSCSGTIGNVVLISDILKNYIFSQHSLRVIPNEFAGYLYTYFKTEIGRTLVNSNKYGAVIQHIEPEHLEFVPVPFASEKIRKKIHDLIILSYDLRDEANSLIDQAESILIKELNLPIIESISPDYFDKRTELRSYTVRLETLSNRFDGSYHNPIVASILDFFLDNAESIKPLSSLSKEITMPGIFKRIYVDEDNGVPFLGTNDILELNPKIEKFLSKVGHKKLIEKELSVNENTILITDRGTIGNVVLIPEYYEKESWTVSQNSIRIVPNSNDIAGYIYIFLNSDYGKVLSKRETYGAVIDMIDPSNAGQIPIPILKNKSAMKKINDLALKANKLRAEAYYKEKEAIKIMNNEVIFATED